MDRGYETEHEPGVGTSEADREFFEDLTSCPGAGICGRGMCDSAERGGTNPFGGRLWVANHRLEDAPDLSANRLIARSAGQIASSRTCSGDLSRLLVSGRHLVA